MTQTAAPLPAEEHTEPAPLSRGFGWMLVSWGLLGLLASMTLAIDKVKLLQDPSYSPSCNFNPVLSCGSVMATDQASVFGFPNPFIGIASFAAVLTIGVLVAGRVVMPRWVLTGLAVGSVLGSVFVHWLAYQSLYSIGALCPWCMVVWAVTIPTTVWAVLLTLRSYDVDGSSRLVEGLWDWRYALVVLWYVLVVVLALVRFWDYWQTLL